MDVSHLSGCVDIRRDYSLSVYLFAGLLTHLAARLPGYPTLHQMDPETPLTVHEFFVVLSEGIRGKVTITAKADGVIVGVTNSALLSRVDPKLVPLTKSITQHDQVAGIRRIQNEDGTMTVVPSEKVKTDIRLFVETTPCWFPECESLRAAYNAELLALPEGCPSCEKGSLIRKYLKKMETINTDVT